MHRCQSMEEYSKAPGACVYPANHERNEDKSCDGSLPCHSGGEILRHSSVGEFTIRRSATYGANTTAEKMLELQEQEIEFAQRRAQLEGKREYEVSRQSSVGEFTIRRSSTRACVEGC